MILHTFLPKTKPFAWKGPTLSHDPASLLPAGHNFFGQKYTFYNLISYFYDIKVVFPIAALEIIAFNSLNQFQRKPDRGSYSYFIQNPVS